MYDRREEQFGVKQTPRVMMKKSATNTDTNKLCFFLQNFIILRLQLQVSWYNITRQGERKLSKNYSYNLTQNLQKQTKQKYEIINKKTRTDLRTNKNKNTLLLKLKGELPGELKAVVIYCDVDLKYNKLRIIKY